MLAAKSRPALTALCAAFEGHNVTKKYVAVLRGRLEGGGTIERALGGKAAASRWAAVATRNTAR